MVGSVDGTPRRAARAKLQDTQIWDAVADNTG